MVDYQAMGRRMKMKRRSMHLSQLDVAKAAQISPSYYGNIERGTRIPSIDTLVLIANALNDGADYLLFDSLKIAYQQHSPAEMRRRKMKNRRKRTKTIEVTFVLWYNQCA